MPALNQQEGTFTSINKRVVPTNVAMGFNGYCLNDIANELGLENELTIDYTKELSVEAGFSSIEFDDLPNEFDRAGNENRGYLLNVNTLTFSDEIEQMDEIKEMSNVIYLANPVHQFSVYTNRAHQLNEAGSLYAS